MLSASRASASPRPADSSESATIIAIRGRHRARLRVVLQTFAIGVLSFAAGFLTHREQAYEAVLPLISYATGNASGCDFASMLKYYSRSRRVSASISAAKLAGSSSPRDADGFVLWRTPLGQLWSPVGTNVTLAVGEQLAEVYTEGPMNLGPVDVVLDCGANVGDFVRSCLRAKVAKVVAIDPSPQNVQAMRRSFAEEIARGQVVIVPKGVWHEDAELKMQLHDNTLLDSFVMTGRTENRGGMQPREATLPLTTVDSIVEELQLDKVTFIKMDIEGAERNAIRGAARTISRFRPRMALATENLDDDYRVVPQEVEKLGQNYAVSCGLCQRLEGLRYRPDILFFIPR